MIQKLFIIPQVLIQQYLDILISTLGQIPEEVGVNNCTNDHQYDENKQCIPGDFIFEEGVLLRLFEMLNLARRDVICHLYCNHLVAIHLHHWQHIIAGLFALQLIDCMIR